jgi:hypothetical protein
MAHKTLYPHIWTRSLHDVEWFGPPPELPLNEKDTNPFFSHYEEIESTAARKKHYRRDSVEEPAPWTLPTIRCGVDPPFARKPSQERKITSPFEKLSPLPPILSPSIVRVQGPVKLLHTFIPTLAQKDAGAGAKKALPWLMRGLTVTGLGIGLASFNRPPILCDSKLFLQIPN